MRFPAVLFDLDGTLIDTIPDIIHAVNAMCDDLGLEKLSDTTITAYVGRGSDNLVRRVLTHNTDPSLVSEDTLIKALQIFQTRYHEVNGKYSHLFDGVMQGLQDFAHTGAKLAIVTNKATAFTLPLLRLTGLIDFFDAIVCGDTCTEKKPHPMPVLHACSLLGVAPENTLLIGDSVNDALAARAAKVTVLILPYGYNEGQDVRDLEVDDIVESITDAALWAANTV